MKMKGFIRWTVWMLMAFALAFTSCSKDEERHVEVNPGRATHPIVGIWYNSAWGAFDLYYEDGRFERYAHVKEEGNEYYDYWEGKYVIDSDLLTIRYESWQKNEETGEITKVFEEYDFNYVFYGNDYFEQTYYGGVDDGLRTEKLERVWEKDVEYLGVRKEVEAYYNLR